MSKNTVRPLISVAAFSWLVVGGYGLWEVIAEDSSDNWEIAYSIFAIALLVGSLLTLVAVWMVTRRGEHPVVRSIGLAVSALGVLSTVVAWALPVWMTLIAVGYVLIALSGSQSWRRPVAFLAVAQLLGGMTMFIGLAAELGPRDEYGDYPAAFGIGLVVTAAATLMSLYKLDRSVSASVPLTSARAQTAAP
jgi:heme/copper-type cytochrome/quinol oxidase subunit 4